MPHIKLRISRDIPLIFLTIISTRLITKSYPTIAALSTHFAVRTDKNEPEDLQKDFIEKNKEILKEWLIEYARETMESPKIKEMENEYAIRYNDQLKTLSWIIKTVDTNHYIYYYTTMAILPIKKDRSSKLNQHIEYYYEYLKRIYDAKKRDLPSYARSSHQDDNTTSPCLLHTVKPDTLEDSLISDLVNHTPIKMLIEQVPDDVIESISLAGSKNLALPDSRTNNETNSKRVKYFSAETLWHILETEVYNESGFADHFYDDLQKIQSILGSNSGSPRIISVHPKNLYKPTTRLSRSVYFGKIATPNPHKLYYINIHNSRYGLQQEFKSHDIQEDSQAIARTTEALSIHEQGRQPTHLEPSIPPASLSQNAITAQQSTPPTLPPTAQKTEPTPAVAAFTNMKSTPPTLPPTVQTNFNANASIPTTTTDEKKNHKSSSKATSSTSIQENHTQSTLKNVAIYGSILLLITKLTHQHFTKIKSFVHHKTKYIYEKTETLFRKKPKEPLQKPAEKDMLLEETQDIEPILEIKTAS